MKIYLVRHGIASEANGSTGAADSQRPLTADGSDKIRKVALALKKLNIKPNLILSSPYVRAEQTAAILAEEFDCKKNVRFSALLVPAGKAGTIIREIVENDLVDELLIVGHEPCLSLLIGTLAAASNSLAINLKKGGVCCLSANDLRLEQRATLEWLLTPKILLKV